MSLSLAFPTPGAEVRARLSGNAARLSADDLTYQWQRSGDGKTWTDVENTGTEQEVFTVTTGDVGALYRGVYLPKTAPAFFSPPPPRWSRPYAPSPP